MMGYIEGEVVFSDGQESIIKAADGIGYQIFSYKVFPEGGAVSLYLSQIVRETSNDLYGFTTLRDKKMFELLLTVKGVGPKSAFALVGNVGFDQLLNAVRFEDKKTLSKAPGIGAKAASQIILDLSEKIEKVVMYSDTYTSKADEVGSRHSHSIVEDAILACKELGFSENKILPLMRKIMDESQVSKAEQLVHLVLREM